MQSNLNLYPNLVRARRKTCTQQKLAEHLGISQQEISRYERGEIKAPINYIIDVADYCGVSVDYIHGRMPNENIPLNNDEETLLNIFQSLSSENKIRLLERAAALNEDENRIKK